MKVSTDRRGMGGALWGALLAAGLTAAPAFGLGTGEGRGPSPAPAPAQGEAAALAPRRGGELRFGLTTEPATLDPLSSANTADGRSILFNVYEGLVKSDRDGRLQPAAAAEWAVEGGGLVYTFTLREGLVFSDGAPVRAADAVFSLNTARNQNFAGFNQIEKAEALNERKVRVTLKESDPEFLPYLTIGIVPASNSDREKNPVGAGPFVIDSYLPQQSLTLTRNPRYWREGSPYLDKVIIRFIANSDALLTGLRGGSLDGATLTGAYVEQLAGGGFDVVTGNSNTVQLLALNNAAKPLDDPRVRKSISYAVDPQEIIDLAFFGRGEPSGSPLIPGLTAYYDASLRNPYPKDIAKAKALLAEAGAANGFNLEITVPSNYTMHVDTANVIVNQLERIGIKAAVRMEDWAAWLSETYRGRKYQATIISLDAGNVSPRSFLNRYVSGAGGNFINFNNSDYDRVYAAALKETDPERRAALYKEAQRVISNDAASVYIQDIKSFYVFAGGRFAGLITYPLYVLDFASVYSLE